MSGGNWLVTCTLADYHLFFGWAWKLTWFTCGWFKLTWFQCGGSNLTWFQCRDETDLVYVWVVDYWLRFWTRGANHLLLVWAYKLTSNWLAFCVGVSNWLDFSVGYQTWLDSSVRLNPFGCCVGYRRLLHFSVVGRRWFCFYEAVENDLFSASASKLTGFLCRRIVIQLILEWRSKLIWFRWWGRNWLGFYVRDRSWLGFRVEIELDCFFVRGSKSIRFCVRAENCLILIYGSTLNCFLAWSKLTWFCVRAENDLFLVRGSIDLVLVRVVEIDLVFFAGRKSLGFSLSIELDFVLVWVVDIDLISLWGIELDLISV